MFKAGITGENPETAVSLYSALQRAYLSEIHLLNLICRFHPLGNVTGLLYCLIQLLWKSYTCSVSYKYADKYWHYKLLESIPEQQQDCICFSLRWKY